MTGTAHWIVYRARSGGTSNRDTHMEVACMAASCQLSSPLTPVPQAAYFQMLV